MIAIDADYCPLCGAAVEHRNIDGRARAYCPDCERVLWRNAVPGVTLAVVDRDTGQVCCIRRGQPPKAGAWALPGGHIEHDEAPRVGAVRELAEETGLVADPASLAVFATDLSCGSERNHAVIHFAVRRAAVTGSLDAGDDAAAVTFLTPDAYAQREAMLHEPETLEAALSTV